MALERAIIACSEDAEDVRAGLQIFLDHVKDKDSGIKESMQELATVSSGLIQLHDDALEFRPLPSRLDSDIRLMLQGLEATLDHVYQMFKQTQAKKHKGNIPFARIWSELGLYLEHEPGGYSLRKRLEIISVFLVSLINGIRGGPHHARTLDKDRKKLSSILRGQTYPGNALGLAPELARAPALMSAAPWGHPDSDFPFSKPNYITQRPNNPASAHTSHASWQSHSSSRNSSGSRSDTPDTRWTLSVFRVRHASSPFPSEMPYVPCAMYGRPTSNIFTRFADRKYELLVKLRFQADNFGIQFWRQQSDGHTRIATLLWDKDRVIVSSCTAIAKLKLTRAESTLLLWRKEPEEDSYQKWATLSFDTSEHLVLFYSTFVALKYQDESTPIKSLYQDYFHTETKPEIQKFGGEMIYSPQLRHALRIYMDKYTRAVRIEARPLTGSKAHVPVWTAFITHKLCEPDWLDKPEKDLVELRGLHQHVFNDWYIPTKTRRNNLKIRFAKQGDCEIFCKAIEEMTQDRAT